MRQTASTGMKSIAFAGYGGGGLQDGIWGWANQLAPSAQYDYRRGAGVLWENSIVLAGLKWESDAFTEAPFCVRKRKGPSAWEIVEGHPLTLLMQTPNPFWDEAQLLQACRMSYSLDGNAYLYKRRSAAGKVVELWWMPHWQVSPSWDKDGQEFLTHYEYRVNNRVTRLKTEDVIHFRDGTDPANYRKGLSRLSAVLKEICTDNERATFSAAVLRNGGVPSVVISPMESGEFPMGKSPDTISRLWMEKTTGDRRGEPFVSELPMKIDKPGFNPSELILDKIARIPETRISAALRIPAIVLGLEAGLAHATYSNYEQALKAAYYHNVIPAYRVFAATIDRALLGEMMGPSMCRSGFDTSDVQALQEDKNSLANRSAILYKAGVAKRMDSREMNGLPFDPSHDDLYITDMQAGAGSQGSLGQVVSLPDGGAKSLSGHGERLLVTAALEEVMRAIEAQEPERARTAIKSLLDNYPAPETYFGFERLEQELASLG
jgi:HK97 family phage portal protein